MKHIEWHNPANQTPPKGYRLLIPEEVDETLTQVIQLTVFGKWVDTTWSPTNHSCTYAVPNDTPLPEGYALINGQVWRLDGWTLHTPGNMMYVNSHIQADTLVEVQYRNGTRCTAQKRQHHFGQLKSRDAEIIAWRIVEQARERMTATEVLEQQSKSPSERRMDAAIQQLRQQLEDIKSVLDENQRLKNELADAQATLKSIRSLLP